MSTNPLVKTSCFTVVLALFSLLLQAQPVANFSASPISGCAPLVVNFTDLSTGNPTQWRWDLGNGTISFLKNPSVTYFNPGQYTVKLVVQNASGKDSLIKSQYITIFAQPTVAFSASATSGCFPLPVQFTDASVAGSGTITQREWDFGDGNFSTQSNPSHTYTSSGNFNVSLRITNSNGCVKTITKLQYIQILNGVRAAFSNTLPNSCTPPVNINFQNLSLGTGTINYSWDFGDGSTSSASNPSHIYNTPGTYSVRLISTNSTGCADTLLKVNAITIGSVDANFSVPATACVNTPINISNTSVPAPVSAIWNFGDGTVSNLLNPTKSYTNPGTYSIKLVSNFGACIDSITKTITVVPKLTSAFTASPVSSCQAPLAVTFSNSTTGASSSHWNFGDGTTSTESNPTHTYTTSGVYTVTLVSTNASGCSDTLVRSQFINISQPQITINNLPKKGCAPLPVTFSATVSGNDPVTSYLWTFGDGTTSTDVNPTHIFAPGVYDIKLTITTAGGCTSSTTVVEGVKAGIKPVANFIADPRQVCAMVPINFTDSSTGNIDQWFWEFGDGGASTAQSPTYVYTDTGEFDVQLIVVSNGCADTIKFFKYIDIDPPIAIFSSTFDCNSGGKRVFRDESIGADTWHWDFGDGTTTTEQHPVHIYTNLGNYTVTLTVTNFTTGCSYTTTQDVLIFIASADFKALDTVICKNSEAVFNSIANSPYIATYAWDFGDGTTATGDSVTHVYPNAGLYDITLITTDINGCIDTLIKEKYIRVDGPTAGFGLVNPGNCSMSAVNFTDSSTTDGTHPITTWTWNYGDGIIETLTGGPFQHVYSAPGIYTLSLTVTDSQGCSDSLTKTNELIISQPVAKFSASDTVACPRVGIAFSNLSTGTGLTYSWNLGDGFISTLNNFTHAYANDGLYTVSLKVVDQYGCTDTMIKTNYIRITTPLANFNMSDSAGTCPPLVINFINTSTNYTSLLWDFGDGSTSQSANPSHFYSTPGSFIASLTVFGPTGCTSIKTKTIFVRGPEGTFTYGPLNGCDSVKVTFTASTRNRHSFVWDFNDGNTLATTDSIVSHTYRIHGSYVPKMILIDQGGCVVPITGPDTIHVRGATASVSFSAEPVCNSGFVQFNNNTETNDGIASYEWNFGDGTTSTEAEPLHYYSAPGLYHPKLTVKTLSGCLNAMVSTIPVKVVAAPQALISKTENGCTPVTVSFKGSLGIADTSALTWKWFFGNGQTSSLQNPLPVKYTTAGNYAVTLMVSNSSGCTDTISTNIEAFIVPVVFAGGDTIVCKGGSFNLNATGAQTYVWAATPGLSCYDCNNPVASPDSLKTYFVIGTNAQGCSGKDSISIDVKFPFSMLDSGADTVCLGTGVRLRVSGAHAYQWSPSTGLSSSTSANPMANPRNTIIYRVIGTDNMKCFTDTAYIPLKVFPIPTVEAGADKTINVGQVIDLIPELSADVTKVTWSPTGNIFRNNYPAITVKPRETTTYRVDVSNSGGCVARDNITIHVICNGANVFIPNTFTPNGDGANDVFYPRGTGLFTIKSARIFNRWGEIVYERSNFQANDVSAAWDGTYKGIKLNPDIYVYVIDVLCDNNTTLPFKGNIALLK